MCACERATPGSASSWMHLPTWRTQLYMHVRWQCIHSSTCICICSACPALDLQCARSSAHHARAALHVCVPSTEHLQCPSLHTMHSIAHKHFAMRPQHRVGLQCTCSHASTLCQQLWACLQCSFACSACVALPASVLAVHECACNAFPALWAFAVHAHSTEPCCHPHPPRAPQNP